MKKKANVSYMTNVRPLAISASYIRDRLDAGSKKRLDEYQNSLIRSRGIEKPLFDDKLVDLLGEYVYDKGDFANQIDYLNHLRDEDGYLFSRDLRIYSSAEKAMLRFCDDNYTSFRWNQNYQRAKEKMISEVRNWFLKPLSYACDQDAIDVLPKAKSHSGFYAIISGKKYKIDNMEGIVQILNDKLKEVLREGTFNTPILIGFRTQGSGEYDDEGNQTNTCKHKTRVISMVDLLWCLAEFMFMKPFQHRFDMFDFYAGGKSDTDIMIILRDWWGTKRYNRFFSIDYSAYDQSVSNWLIEDAYDIIGSAFIMTDDQKKIFEALKHDAVHKDFILYEGVVHSDKGVPSGLPFTQIVDTIVNRLMTLTFFYSMDENDFQMMAMGDDNIIFTNADISIDLVASYMAKNFGMTVNTDDKFSEGRQSNKDDPKFLSKFWRHGGTWRSPHQLISRIAFPENYRNYESDPSKEFSADLRKAYPHEVLYAFILTYKLGMYELMDVPRFMRDYPYLNDETVLKVGIDSLPGSLKFRLRYANCTAA